MLLNTMNTIATASANAFGMRTAKTLYCVVNESIIISGAYSTL